MAELIRVYHDLSLEEAQAIVDSVAERSIPIVWEVGGKKRVLEPSLNYLDKALLLLYTDVDSGVLVEDLVTWVEHPRRVDFDRRVLKPLHDRKLIEWDRENEIAYLSPLGIDHVEKKILARG